MSLLVRPKLLILDETGYLALDFFAANCLFQLVSERYEKGSIILTLESE
jgi:DNA replication protein DnaC